MRIWGGMLAGVTLTVGLAAQPALAQVTTPADTTTQENATTTSAAPIVASPQPAGQAPAVSGRRSYDAEYFRQYAPANALDLIQRVPGFTLDEGDTERRGFGGAAGNVVINGQRPSSKSDTLQTILQRIPAGRVLRVEVGTGDLFGAEFSGKPQVANLVMATGAGTSGTIEARLLRDYTGGLRPAGSFSAITKTGPHTFNASATFENENTTEEGPDRLVRASDGVETELRDKTNHIKRPTGALAASWEYNGGTNRTAHLNIRAARDKLSLTQRNFVYPLVGPDRHDRLTQRYLTDAIEVGGDVTRPLAGGGIKLIGLVTRRWRQFDDVSFLRLTDESVLGGFSQALNDRYAETLARLVWTRGNLHGWNVEAGAEGVVNRLDSNVDLFSFGQGGVATRIDLPVDQAVVKEVRGEGFVNAGRALSKQVRLDLGVTYERSRITVSGDATSTRTLSFWKPKAVLDWRPGDDWRLQFTAQRTVAQLQFEDFISSAELTNERVNGGNAELLPQRSWEFTAVVERPILGDGIFRTELGYRAVSKVQDRVPTPEGFDAPGNLGSGRVLVLRNRLEAPLKSFGIKGGRLTLYSSLVPTRVRDPYTLTYRPFTGNSKWYGEANFRQDLGKWAWGVNAYVSTDSTAYRRNELDTSIQAKPYLDAFAEWRPDARTTVRLTIDNLLDSPVRRSRVFFDPDRSSLTPVLFENRRRNKHVIPILTVKRTFG